MFVGMTKETEAKWAVRVEQWRGSGQSAEEFAASRGYEGSTLRWAASRLQHASKSTPTSRRTTRRAPWASEPPPRFIPVRAITSRTATEMVVEVGAARIRVAPGVDLSLLGDVVRALGEVAR
jgi:hypothetical protein